MPSKLLSLLVITIITTSNLHCAEMDIDTDQDTLSEDLFKAIEEENIQAIRKILNTAGFDVYEALNYNDDSPLHQAALKGNLEIVNLLLQREDNLIDRVNHQSMTPLHFAAFSGNRAVVNALLNQKPRLINEEDDSRVTPLHLAVEAGHVPIVARFIERGASVTKATRERDTPLHFTVHNNNVDSFMDIATMLLHAGGELYKKNIHGKTPLDLIVNNYGLQVARNLEYLGAQPLFNAVKEGYLNQVKMLLDNGYNPFAKNEFCQTPLEVAQQYDQKELVEFLKELSTEPLTERELSDLQLADLIYYDNRLWSKKGLFNLAFNSITRTATGILNPFNRQPLPPHIVATLKQHFRISEQEYRHLIAAKKYVEQIRGNLSTEGYAPEPGARVAWQAALDQYDKIINDFLEQKGIL